jgi:hypothetical protein
MLSSYIFFTEVLGCLVILYEGIGHLVGTKR